jgi:hypothetical protein
MPTTTENVLFGTNAYEGPANVKLKHDLPGAWKQMNFDIEILDVKATGFRAHVYHNDTTKEVVIAYAGTHLADRGDLEAIRAIIAGRRPKQFNNALAVYRAISELLERKRIRTQIFFTGHSLGGALAQYMAIAVKGCPTETFGAPGILTALEDLNGTYDRLYPYPVVNHVAAGDIYGNYGVHVGTVVRHVIDPTDVLLFGALLRIRPLLFFTVYSGFFLHGAERYRHALNQREGAFDPVHPNYIKDDGYKIDAGPKKKPVWRW